MVPFNNNHQIVMPKEIKQMVVQHCLRKLAEQFLDGEDQERKAFGLLAGKCNTNKTSIQQCIPLLKNARYHPPYNFYMDELMTNYATPSETPFQKRGWIADPEEYLTIVKKCRHKSMEIIGAYHMHRVAWPHDPLRDKPTKVDNILASESKNFAFIVSMVDPSQPVIRAFYEGVDSQEATISFVD